MGVTTLARRHIPVGVVASGVWAIGDQGAVSLGTFLTNLLLARNLSSTEYGTYGLLIGLMQFLNGVHGSIVTYPLTVWGASLDTVAMRRLTSAFLANTFGLAAVLGLALVAASAVLGHPDLAPITIAVLIAWQVQECLRRALIAQRRYREATIGDTLSYLGQAALVWLAIRYQSITFQAALGAAFVAFCAGGAVFAALQRGLLLDWRQGLAHWRQSWELGRWALGGSLVSALVFQAVPWTLALSHGPEAAAGLLALVGVLGVTHPLQNGLSNVIMPGVALRHERGGFRSATRYAAAVGSVGLCLLIPYYVFLLVLPGFALSLFYGQQSPYVALGGPLKVFVLSYAVNYVAQILGSLVAGVKNSRATFSAQLSAAVSSMLVGLPLTAVFGVPGAVVGSVTVGLVRTGSLLHSVRSGWR